MTNREFFAQLCSSEYPKFVGVLEATPGDQLEYRPHPRSRSAFELVGHLIAHEQDLLELAETGTINHRMQTPFGDVSEAVQIYRDAHTAVSDRLSRLRDEDWNAMGRFIVQGNVIMEKTRGELAWILLLDAIHHRGQLSTYLRPMGGKVPPIYGPSADAMMTTA
jgi:uncharacterized damage-inducible protein DinB